MRVFLKESKEAGRKKVLAMRKGLPLLVGGRGGGVVWRSASRLLAAPGWFSKPGKKNTKWAQLNPAPKTSKNASLGIFKPLSKKILIWAGIFGTCPGPTLFAADLPPSSQQPGWAVLAGNEGSGWLDLLHLHLHLWTSSGLKPLILAILPINRATGKNETLSSSHRFCPANSVK